MDAQALIVVGLTVDKLDITTMPLYEEFCELVDSGELLDSFDELIGEFYYGNHDLPNKLAGLTVIKPHVDGSGEKQTVVGFVLAQSDDWTPMEIDLFYSVQKTNQIERQFQRIFHKYPRVYLVPRYW